MTKTAALFLAACLTSAAVLAQDAPQMNLPRVKLSAGMHQIDSLAATPEHASASCGARRCRSTRACCSCSSQRETQCFWMKNTLLPLTIAFVDDDGHHRQPGRHEAADDRLSHCSAKPVRFALEMNQGWFAKRGIKAGYKLPGKPFGDPMIKAGPQGCGPDTLPT
jgi:hypothetical protein